MSAASAPGKVILLGEHAVVFGKPAIALAISLRLRCSVEHSEQYLVNGLPATSRNNSYLMTAVEQIWKGGPLSIDTTSEVPAGSGLGSSAAVTVATLGAVSQMEGDISPERVARAAFDVESLVQGRASPIDTSVATHGRGIFIDSVRGPDLLWEIRRDTRHWFIHDASVPKLPLVVGFTGIKKPTGPLVAKVKRYVDRNTFAKEIIDEIGNLTLDGLKALRAGDLELLGRLMTRDHNLLAILGASSPELQKLVDVSLPYSYGAKLTGAGGGGSMIALTDRPDKVAQAIKSRGGVPFIVRTGVEGLRKEKD